MNIKTQISRLLREEQTKAEAKLWKYLRGRRFENLKFRRQHPIKEYIVDFINIEYQIIIELDGEYHNDILQKEKDALRDLHLKALGYKVLRFENEVVFKNPDLILSSIKEHIRNTDSPSLYNRDNESVAKTENHHHPNSNNISSPIVLTMSSQERRNYSILSTKKLSTSQKELLLSSGIGFVVYDAIKIELLKVDKLPDVQNAIFTSKNAVKSVLSSGTNISNCFCVGDNTKKLLEENGQKVIENAQNASNLAKIIAKKHKDESFLFFCGNLRRNELPDLLKERKIALKEQIVYKTHPNSKKFDRSFEGILFFSPSGVQSFVSENDMDSSIAFCIGKTTASEAKKYTDNIIIANKPTVENVIVQAVKYFK